MKFLLSALVALLIAAPALADEVWRTVDAKGLVVFSDRPLSSESVRVSVATSSAAPGPETAPQAPATPRGEPSAVNAAARAEQAELVAQACAEARTKLAAYEKTPRLYQELPGGGRRYLTDEETIAARQQARQAVEDFCTD
jgi:hypothetical protein